MINFDRKQNYLCPREHWDWFVFIWKVINIAANCSERNCTRNGSFRGRPAIPQSGWQQGGAGEEGLQLGQLCSQDEHHRHGGAGDTQVRVATVHMYCVLYLEPVSVSDIGGGVDAQREMDQEEAQSQGARVCLLFKMDQNCKNYILMSPRAAYSLSRERKHFASQ